MGLYQMLVVRSLRGMLAGVIRPVDFRAPEP